jgi:hypothetical protein
MHKESFIINCNTVLHVSTLLGHLQGELFVIVTLRLRFIVVFGGVNSPRSAGPQRVDASSTEYTVNSTFSLNHKVQP